MKKILFILMALLAINVTAQKRGKHNQERSENFKDFSTEEIALLKTKKLTLTLDLDKNQQRQVSTLLLKTEQTRKQRIEERKGKKIETKKDEKPSKEKRLAMMNKRLDEKIAVKLEMKNILNEEQFVKWEKIQARKGIKKRNMLKKRVKREK